MSAAALSVVDASKKALRALRTARGIASSDGQKGGARAAHSTRAAAAAVSAEPSLPRHLRAAWTIAVRRLRNSCAIAAA
jgi:hypothetical protein